LRPLGVKLVDFRTTLIEIGDELDSSVSNRDRVAVKVDDYSVSFCLITSFLGGDPSLFLKEGVFFIVKERSLRDRDVVALVYRLLGDFELSSFGMERCNGY
jgi:hypothetical protein